MFKIEKSGDLTKTFDFLKRMSSDELFNNLSRYGQKGVKALSAATPQDTGKTASSWEYKVKMGRKPSIAWYNTNVVNGCRRYSNRARYRWGRLCPRDRLH